MLEPKDFDNFIEYNPEVHQWIGHATETELKAAIAFIKEELENREEQERYFYYEKLISLMKEINLKGYKIYFAPSDDFIRPEDIGVENNEIE